MKTEKKPEPGLFERANEAWDDGDLKLAFCLFHESASAGDESSQINLGFFYDEGIGTKKNKDKAIFWYMAAYRNGSAAAASNIAILNKEQKQNKKALWWFRRSIAMGDGDAYYELAKCYEKGIGTRKNIIKAITNYQKAISSSNATEHTKEQAEKALKRLKHNKAL